MLEARPVGVWGRRYDMVVDGRSVTTWDSTWWRSGGTFDLDGRSYRVQGNFWGSEYTMTDESGATVATAGRIGRRNWSVTAGGQTYTFQRTGFWRTQQELRLGGQTVGTIKRASGWRNAAIADLPGLTVPLQVFTVGVVLTVWANEQAAAASAT